MEKCSPIVLDSIFSKGNLMIDSLFEIKVGDDLLTHRYETPGTLTAGMKNTLQMAVMKE